MRTHLIVLAAAFCGDLVGQATAPTKTPWQVTSTYSFNHPGPAGTAVASNQDVAMVPAGYNAVIEHLSARCVATPTLTIVFGEILISSDPLNPGQSGVAGVPRQVDTANISLLFKQTYSGGVSVYVASEQVSLHVNAPVGRVIFSADFFDSANDNANVTCLVSVSGYLEKQ